MFFLKAENDCSIDEFKYIFIAFLIYAPSTVFIPPIIYYFLAPAFLFFSSRYGLLSSGFLFTCGSLTLSLLLSLFVIIVTGDFPHYYGNPIFIQISLLVSLIISSAINEKVAKYICLFICVEIAISIVEYFLGVTTLFNSIRDNIHGGYVSNSEFLYNRRVYGISTNSSVLAGKAIILLTLYYFFLNKQRLKSVFVFVAVFSCLFVTFSRSAFIAIAFFYFLYFFNYLFSVKLTKRVISKVVVLAVIGIVVGIFLCVIYSDNVSYFLDYVVSQLTRGKNVLDVSGRDIIVSNYISAIEQNVLWGNGSVRNYLSIVPYGYMHAHNSFIMLVYMCGLIPAFFIFIPFFISFVSRVSCLLIMLPLIFYSTFQYYIFWGASIEDVVIFSILLKCFPNVYISKIK